MDVVSTATETSVHAVETSQFAVNTEDTLGHNAMIIQEDRAFVPQGILVATTTNADARTFVDGKIIVHPRQSRLSTR
jgi:hypothetical protein